MSGLIYLDYNATTPVDERVVQAMLPYFTTSFGNASSSHRVGVAAKAAVDRAREQVASAAGASPGDVYFTSGSTESVNLALKGLAVGAGPSRRQIVTVATEHKAVLESAEVCRTSGCTVVSLPVNGSGMLDLDELESVLEETTLLVSVMGANNETGVLQPIAEIAELTHAHGALFHCDATQMIGKAPFSMHDQGVDLASISSHKIYGPQGVGALLATAAAAQRIVPLVHGGGHERGLRSGTANLPGIVGFGAAATLAASEQGADCVRLGMLRDRLESGLLEALPAVSINGGDAPRLNSTTNVRFAGADSDSVMLRMPNVAVSSGSACTAASVGPSHVLLAMGMSYDAAQESIRFSLGRPTTDLDVEAALPLVIGAVRAARVEAA